MNLVVQTGLEPANYTLERRAARPLPFCTKSEISTTYKFEKLFLTASRFGLAETVGVEPTSVFRPINQFVSFLCWSTQ